MIFDPSTAPHLKPWLVRTLEPICDAEPGALADYILALLKHNVPENEMRKELAVQLDEFLEKAECASFIDTLFTVLRTKSYLPYSASPSSPSFGPKALDTGIPIPLDGLLSPSLSTSPDRNLKRSMETDERDGRAPAKGPRLSTEGEFSRYTNGHGGRPENRSTGGWGGRGGRSRYGDGVDMYGGGMPMSGVMLPGMNGSMGQTNGRRPQVYQPPDQKRGICRDYHNNGYCARGAMCKYSHGDDAVIPGMYPMNPAMAMPFMPMFAGPGNPFGMAGGVGAAYDPHEARMDMRPRHQRAPLLPRIQQEDGTQVVQSTNASGELPVIQDLTPMAHDTSKPLPGAASVSESTTQPSHPSSPQQQQLPMHSEGYHPADFGAMQHAGTNGQPYMPMNLPMDVDMSSQLEMRPPIHTGHPRPMRGRGRGGIFGGEVHRFRPERRNDKTLVVEKIPEDKLTLEQVNVWFKRFGTVTNVAIDSMNAKALISFSNHDEAYAAWKSEDAVFNNRFVKVFWHRPMEGHGQVGARMLAASAPLVASISAKETPSWPVSVSKPTAPQKPSTSATTTALAAKQQLLEQQIAEQKSLMASLDTASPEEKKTIMARLRKLGEEMKTSAPTAEASTVKTDVGLSDHERKERERLDKELEMHAATGPAEGEETTEDLKAKLEKLKAEAASLGIATESPYRGGYRPYRGRGRGIRGYRGAMRGAPPPRASMKLDNRPKKLLVKGVREEGVQALRDWFETTGQMESLQTTENGDIIVAFRSRAAAEQGLAKGTDVPTVGRIQVTWHTGTMTGSTPAANAASPGTSDASDAVMKEPPRPHSPGPLHSPHVQDEEVETSGWGGDDDGEHGMGML